MFARWYTHLLAGIRNPYAITKIEVEGVEDQQRESQQPSEALAPVESDAHSSVPVLDPLSTVIRLYSLKFRPLHTKLSIVRHSIDFHYPTLYQGLWRRRQGASRNDLCYIKTALEDFVFLYDTRNEHVRSFGLGAIQGLERFALCYQRRDAIADLASNSIQYYQLMLRTALPSEHEKKCMIRAAGIGDGGNMLPPSHHHLHLHKHPRQVRTQAYSSRSDLDQDKVPPPEHLEEDQRREEEEEEEEEEREDEQEEKGEKKGKQEKEIKDDCPKNDVMLRCRSAKQSNESKESNDDLDLSRNHSAAPVRGTEQQEDANKGLRQGPQTHMNRKQQAQGRKQTLSESTPHMSREGSEEQKRDGKEDEEGAVAENERHTVDTRSEEENREQATLHKKDEQEATASPVQDESQVSRDRARRAHHRRFRALWTKEQIAIIASLLAELELRWHRFGRVPARVVRTAKCGCGSALTNTNTTIDKQTECVVEEVEIHSLLASVDHILHSKDTRLQCLSC